MPLHLRAAGEAGEGGRRPRSLPSLGWIKAFVSGPDLPKEPYAGEFFRLLHKILGFCFGCQCSLATPLNYLPFYSSMVWSCPWNYPLEPPLDPPLQTTWSRPGSSDVFTFTVPQKCSSTPCNSSILWKLAKARGEEKKKGKLLPPCAPRVKARASAPRLASLDAYTAQSICIAGWMYTHHGA